MFKYLTGQKLKSHILPSTFNKNFAVDDDLQGLINQIYGSDMKLNASVSNTTTCIEFKLPSSLGMSGDSYVSGPYFTAIPLYTSTMNLRYCHHHLEEAYVVYMNINLLLPYDYGY